MVARAMIALILTFAAIYAMLVIYMAVFQRKLMYYPEAAPVLPAMFGLHGFSDVNFASDDGTSLQLWYREADVGKPTIVYFHGNAGNLSHRAAQFAAFARAGFGVAAVSYRGYGKSEGSPSEQGIFTDARSAVKWVKSRGIPLSSMVFYGESLGTGVAIRMASEFSPQHVFLQAPYTSVAGRAAEIYWYAPVKLLIRDQFNSMAYIEKISAPLMIFQGRKDPVIPPHHAEALFAAAKEPKDIIFFDHVGHTEFDPDDIAGRMLAALQ